MSWPAGSGDRSVRSSRHSLTAIRRLFPVIRTSTAPLNNSGTLSRLTISKTSQASAAAKITLAAVNGQKPPADLVTSTINNGSMDVPTAKLGATLIHLQKGVDPGTIVQKAVDLGIFTWKQICTGAAAGTATCKAKG